MALSAAALAVVSGFTALIASTPCVLAASTLS
ncbi:Uncharacterised protein [Streptococcus pneumoniae]|nr:Uncharacterised protein [Streptococcus pneumoniae]